MEGVLQASSKYDGKETIMGDRIQKIAGIIFALTFVAIMALMNKQVLQFGSDVNRQVHNSSTVSVDYELEPFNGTTGSADKGISAINNRNSLTSNTLSIEVQYSDGSTLAVYDASTSEKYDHSAGVVGPTGRYKAGLETIANCVIAQICFKLIDSTGP